MNYSRGLVALFTFIILLCTLSTLVPYVFCCARGLADATAAAPGGAAAVVSVLAFVYAMFAIYGAGAETVFYGFLLLLGGLPVYVWMRRARRRMTCTNEYGPLSRVIAPARARRVRQRRTDRTRVAAR